MKFNDPWFAGFCCEIDGPTVDNCDFRLFGAAVSTALWKNGKLDAKKACKKHGRNWLRLILHGLEAPK